MAKRQVANLSPAPKRLIGYARVSTDDQVHDAHMDELHAASCERILQEHGSGASRARLVLTRLLGDLTAGEVLVVVRLDRLARSVSYLLKVIEDLEERGVHFRSIPDPIDTSTRRASHGPREAGRAQAIGSLSAPCARRSPDEAHRSYCHCRSRPVATRHCQPARSDGRAAGARWTQMAAIICSQFAG